MKSDVHECLKFNGLNFSLFIFLTFFRAKIRNIEATEDAKLRLIRNRLNKKDGPSQFVPTNMAVNFVQHNRCEFKQYLLVRFRLPGRAREH